VERAPSPAAFDFDLALAFALAFAFALVFALAFVVDVVFDSAPDSVFAFGWRSGSPLR
jgi:hypothetical protein